MKSKSTGGYCPPLTALMFIMLLLSAEAIQTNRHIRHEKLVHKLRGKHHRSFLRSTARGQAGSGSSSRSGSGSSQLAQIYQKLADAVQYTSTPKSENPGGEWREIKDQEIEVETSGCVQARILAYRTKLIFDLKKAELQLADNAETADTISQADQTSLSTERAFRAKLRRTLTDFGDTSTQLLQWVIDNACYSDPNSYYFAGAAKAKQQQEDQSSLIGNLITSALTQTLTSLGLDEDTAELLVEIVEDLVTGDSVLQTIEEELKSSIENDAEDKVKEKIKDCVLNLLGFQFNAVFDIAQCPEEDTCWPPSTGTNAGKKTFEQVCPQTTDTGGDQETNEEESDGSDDSDEEDAISSAIDNIIGSVADLAYETFEGDTADLKDSINGIFSGIGMIFLYILIACHDSKKESGGLGGALEVLTDTVTSIEDVISAIIAVGDADNALSAIFAVLELLLALVEAGVEIFEFQLAVEISEEASAVQNVIGMIESVIGSVFSIFSAFEDSWVDTMNDLEEITYKLDAPRLRYNLCTASTGISEVFKVFEDDFDRLNINSTTILNIIEDSEMIAAVGPTCRLYPYQCLQVIETETDSLTQDAKDEIARWKRGVNVGPITDIAITLLNDGEAIRAYNDLGFAPIFSGQYTDRIVWIGRQAGLNEAISQVSYNRLPSDISDAFKNGSEDSKQYLLDYYTQDKEGNDGYRGFYIEKKPLPESESSDSSFFLADIKFMSFHEDTPESDLEWYSYFGFTTGPGEYSDYKTPDDAWGKTGFTMAYGRWNPTTSDWMGDEYRDGDANIGDNYPLPVRAKKIENTLGVLVTIGGGCLTHPIIYDAIVDDTTSAKFYLDHVQNVSEVNVPFGEFATTQLDSRDVFLVKSDSNFDDKDEGWLLAKLKEIYLDGGVLDKATDADHDCFIYSAAVLPDGSTNSPIRLQLALEYTNVEYSNQYLAQLDQYWGERYELSWFWRDGNTADTILATEGIDVTVKIVKKYQEGGEEQVPRDCGKTSDALYNGYLEDLVYTDHGADRGCFFATSSSTRYTFDEITGLEQVGLPITTKDPSRTMDTATEDNFNSKIKGLQSRWVKVTFSPEDDKISDLGWTLVYNSDSLLYEVVPVTEEWGPGLPLAGDVIFDLRIAGDSSAGELLGDLDSDQLDYIVASWIPVVMKKDRHIYTLVRPDFNRIPMHFGTASVNPLVFSNLDIYRTGKVTQQSLWSQLDKTTALLQNHPVFGLGFADTRNASEVSTTISGSYRGTTVPEVLDFWINDNKFGIAQLFIPMKFTKNCREGAHYVGFDKETGQIKEKCAGGRIPIGNYYYVEFILTNQDGAPVDYPSQASIDQGKFYNVFPLTGTSMYPADPGTNGWRIVLRLWARPNFVLSEKRKFCIESSDVNDGENDSGHNTDDGGNDSGHNTDDGGNDSGHNTDDTVASRHS
mmetsp:Transcript_16741/g.18813  ORF Transcript_16741/g.18813 Transcript_16741/m.18813 type:complete len:1424 (-) Transcript_16741:151-4422(-)